MDKIVQFKNSFERLLKVWISKLEVSEQDLVAEDLIWIDEIFDKFFNDNNINEFINRDGRYQEVIKLQDFDFADFFNSTVEYSNSKPERWARLKIEEPNQFEFYKQLNEFNSNNYKNYNLIDVYFRLLKNLYYLAVEKDLIKTKSIVLSRILSGIQKVSVFEKEGFNSKSLLSDLYYVVINNLFTSKEIREDRPDEEFISMILFRSTFFVYYLPHFKFPKVPLAKEYLLNTWVYLNNLGKDFLLDQFLNSLSGMTLSNTSLRELDIMDIRSLLNRQEQDSDFFGMLMEFDLSANCVILKNDLDNLFVLIDKVREFDRPVAIEENILEYFLYDGKSRAIELYKFREMQSLVLEFLGLVLHFKEKDYFFHSISRLRKNEQWSNHRTFFPKSINDVIVWLVLLKNVKFQMSGRFDPAFGYKYLNVIVCFLSKGVAFDGNMLKQSLVSKKLHIDPSFLESMRRISNELLSEINQSEFLENYNKESLNSFWTRMVDWFEQQIGESEVLSPIPSPVFENLKQGVLNRYKDKSLMYFLSINLDPFDRKDKAQTEFKSFVKASDLAPRTHLIPDWHTPTYGLTESIGSYLVEQEIMQLEFKLFRAHINYQSEELKRESIKGLVEKFRETSLFLFRNAFPDFWLREVLSSNKESSKEKTISDLPTVFGYRTYDRNSELIIVPRNALAVRYIFDGRLRDLEFIEKTFQGEILDLGSQNGEHIKYVKEIKGFDERYKLSEEELKKYVWLRFAAKAKVSVKNKETILRFRLNPYGE